MGCGASANSSNVNKYAAKNESHKPTARERQAEAAAPSDVAPKHNIPIYFDWSPCEFDVPMPEELKAYNVKEDEYYSFIWTINNDLLEPFAAKWKDSMAESVTKSLLKKSAKKGAEVIGFATPPPAKIVLKTTEKLADKLRTEARRKQWDEDVVTVLEAYLTECNKKCQDMKVNFRVCYCDAPLSPIDLAEVETKRRKAKAMLTADKVTDKMDESAKLNMFAAAFNEKVDHIKVELGKAERKVEYAKEKAESKVEDAKDAAREKVAESKLAESKLGGTLADEDKIPLATKVPCVMFTPC